MNSKIIKICVPAAIRSEDLNFEIDARFGRCNFFIFAEIVNGKIANIKAAKNNAAAQSGGAGISAAEQVADSGVNILFAENIGPKADNVLRQLDIKTIAASGLAADAVTQYIKANLI
ncbi:MAG: NifB/NifX family molybdenum-iron cluster-binding protein [Patescibacteria group bacterium]|nr:NifB/NifX family molybdenum-iron cluster-binding protein [Patescibacteria group bacterium]